MVDWYTLTIIAFLFYGIQNFLFKVSAEKKCNTAWVTLSFMATVAVFSSVLFFILKEPIANIYFLLLISLINATAFFITTVSRMEALKHIATSIAFPIIQMNIVAVVLFSILYFDEKLSIYQIFGIILAILVIFILTRKSEREKVPEKNFDLGITLALIALAFTAVTTVVVKFASMNFSNIAFMAVSYSLNTFFSLALIKKLKQKKENPNHKNAIIIGFFIGVCNFIGFFILLKALSIGPLSLIATINGLSFIIAVILSVLIYKEKVTSMRILGILLAILSMILMRL